MSTCTCHCGTPKIAPFRIVQTNNCMLNNDLGDWKFWDRRKNPDRKQTKRISCRCRKKHCATLQFCEPKDLQKSKRALSKSKSKTKTSKTTSTAEDVLGIFKVRKVPNIPFVDYRCEDLFDIYGSVARDWLKNQIKKDKTLKDKKKDECKTKTGLLSDTWVDAYSKFYKEKVAPPSLTLIGHRRPRHELKTSMSTTSLHKRHHHHHRKSMSRKSHAILGSISVIAPLGYHQPFAADNIFSWKSPRGASDIVVRPDGGVMLEKELDIPVFYTDTRVVKRLRKQFMQDLRSSVFNVPGAVKKITVNASPSIVRFESKKTKKTNWMHF